MTLSKRLNRSSAPKIRAVRDNTWAMAQSLSSVSLVVIRNAVEARGLVKRVTDAALFRWEIYEEIKKDPIASSQARVIVGAGAAAAGTAAVWAGPLAIIAYPLAGLLGWLAFAYLTYWVGTTIFPGRKSDETSSLLFKSLGIAHAPRVLILSGVALPLFSPLIALALFLWVLAAAVPATQYALELDRESATLTAIAGGLALFAISLVVPAVIV